MNYQVFKYLSTHRLTQPSEVNRLIVSAFLISNNLTVKENEFLKSLIIGEKNSSEYESLIEFVGVINKGMENFGMEELIEIFEFVISPADRIINGAIYTPLNIREYIVSQTFGAKNDIIESLKIADISCGCGGFLYNAAKEFKRLTNKSYFDIFKNHIFGFDIQSYSIERTKILLSILALSTGEDRKEFHFNLYVGDALNFSWLHTLQYFTGFDIILGNPPYVCSRHFSQETKNRLSNWAVCKSGHPDLYIPFFQIGIETLAIDGILGFITMNSFFKSLNGRGIREYFQKNSLEFRIIDFGTEQIFKSRYTYTCICFIENRKAESIKYLNTKNLKELLNNNQPFSKVIYLNLDFNKGWNLQNHEIISRIESSGVSFGNLFKTRNGIATLKNEIYIFHPIDEDEKYLYLQNGSIYPIEKNICRDILNSNKLNKLNSLSKIKEKIIFPYNYEANPKVLSENHIKNNFPKAYEYLQSKKHILEGRDYGKGNYENWFAFGRRQSLEKMKYKLFFPHIADKTPNFLINSDESLLFYNGLAIHGNSEYELRIIKKILESKLFWFYIQNTSKPYTSGFFSLSSNYIRNFGICSLSNEEMKFVIIEKDKEILDKFFEEKYGVVIPA